MRIKHLVIDGVLPATPTGLVATPGNAQNVLTWTANSESEVTRSMVEPVLIQLPYYQPFQRGLRRMFNQRYIILLPNYGIR